MAPARSGSSARSRPAAGAQHAAVVCVTQPGGVAAPRSSVAASATCCTEDRPAAGLTPRRSRTTSMVGPLRLGSGWDRALAECCALLGARDQCSGPHRADGGRRCLDGRYRGFRALSTSCAGVVGGIVDRLNLGAPVTDGDVVAHLLPACSATPVAAAQDDLVSCESRAWRLTGFAALRACGALMRTWGRSGRRSGRWRTTRPGAPVRIVVEESARCGRDVVAARRVDGVAPVPPV